MDKTKLIKENRERKVVPLNFRITKTLSTWLKEKNYSPTAVFEETCKDLGFKGVKI